MLRLGNRGRQPRAIDRLPQFQDLSFILLVRVRVYSVLRNVTTADSFAVVVVPPPDPTGTIVEDLERHVLALAVPRQLEVDPCPVPRILFYRVGDPVRIRNDGGRRRRHPSLVAAATATLAALGRWRRHHATRERSFEEVLHFLVDVVDARFFSLVVAVAVAIASVIAFEWAAATASFSVVAIDESSLPARAGKSLTKNVLRVVLVLLVSNITTVVKFVVGVVGVFGRKEELKWKG